jgi:hypothetical protein
MREIHADGWCVRLDLGPQVLGIEVPEVVFGWGDPDEDSGLLLPVPPAETTDPVSAATLLLKAKQFDDGLYAAVELAAQQGAGRFPGKASLLRSLTASLPEATLLAACELGGLGVVAPAQLREAVRQLVDDFLRDELASKPLGFYTWTAELSAIFRQDRFLQQPLDTETANALARAVATTPGAAAAHDACLRLAARLTNPAARPGLRDGSGRRAFLPVSRSHEQVLVERLFGNQPIPEGFNLMTELIRRVQSGQIRLEPSEQSGWYDHQTWSLEPLVVPDQMPEARRLEQGARYRLHLEDLFRGALALARETHVKQAALAMAGCAGFQQRPIWVRPSLTVEPLPSLYARRAASYRFVRALLEEAFGADALAHLHRLTQEGAVATNLAAELEMVEHLFDGAAATARGELGMGHEEVARRFADWRANVTADPDVSRDCRMMVPVFFDLQRRKTKVWAFLGWRKVPVDVHYKTEPRVLSVEQEQPTDRLGALKRKFRQQPEVPPVQLTGERYELAVPVMVEVYVSQLLDRDELRRHCDRHRTRDAIVANLR